MRVGGSQFRDRMQKSETDLLGCQITKTPSQRIGITGLDGSCDKFSAVVQQNRFTPWAAKRNALELSGVCGFWRGRHHDILPCLGICSEIKVDLIRKSRARQSELTG